MASPTDFTLLYNPNWGYNHCSTKAYFQSIPNPTNFQKGYYGIENSSIKGSFHLRYPTDSPLYANKIVLIFEGKQFVSWKENNDNYNYVHQEKIFHKQTKIIWDSTNHHQSDEITTLDLSFEFPLPDNLPTTITSLNVKSYGEDIAGGVAGDGTEIGYITYNLRAQISRPTNIFRLQMNQKKIVDVWCRIHRWQFPEKTLMNHHQPFNWKGNFKENIGYEVELEKTLFNYKDTINIPIKFFINDIRKIKIKKIYVRLKEYHKFKVNNGKSKTIGGFVVANSTFGEQTRKLTTSDNEFYYFIKMQLNLTKTNLGRKLNCSMKTEMIDIWHKLKIKITLEDPDILLDDHSSSSQNIKLEKGITISNFITKQDTSSLVQQRRIMNTWFYNHEENLSKTEQGDGLIKTKQRFSWFGGMKNDDKYNVTDRSSQKKRFSLFGGRNTH